MILVFTFVKMGVLQLEALSLEVQDPSPAMRDLAPVSALLDCKNLPSFMLLFV